MRRLTTATSLVLACAMTPMIAASPVQAATIRMHDKVGDDTTGHGTGDLKWMRIRYGAHRLRLTLKFPASATMSYYQDMYVDTWPKHDGPEIRISTNGDWEGWSVSYADGWKTLGRKQRCSGGVGSADYDFDLNRIRVSIPRGCLKPRTKPQPPRIRMAVATRSETERTYDWMPARHRFGRWVAWK